MAPVVTNAVPRRNLSFVNAQDSRAQLEEYYQTLFNFSPKLIGGQMPDEDFYYID